MTKPTARVLKDLGLIWAASLLLGLAVPWFVALRANVFLSDGILAHVPAQAQVTWNTYKKERAEIERETATN
jgi:hypothetical protein